MGVADYIQTNFTAGELSPLLSGRVDVARYQNGAKLLRNFIARPQGGLMRRPGTKYLGQTKNGYAALMSFQFSVSQSYILEFGNLYVRFWQDDGIITDTNNNPIEVVTPYTAAEVDDLQITQSADVLYIAHGNHQPRMLERFSHTDWRLDPVICTNGPYLPEDITDTTLTMTQLTDRETITSPRDVFVVGNVNKYIQYMRFGEICLGKIVEFTSATVVQVEPQMNVYPRIDSEATVESIAASVLTVTHSIFTADDINKFIRTADDTWYPILAYNGNDRDKVTIGAILPIVSAPDSEASNRRLSATITCLSNLFSMSDVNRVLRLTYNTLQLDCVITTINAPNSVAISFSTPMPRMDNDCTKLLMNGQTAVWHLGAWSSDPTIGWPSCVAFYEQRLVFANTTKEPQTLWFSKTANYTDFMPTESDSKVTADCAITATIASNQINSILWLDTGMNLIIGTRGAEWLAKAYDYSNPLSPSNIMVVQQTTHGSAGAYKVHVGHSIMFVQRSGRAVKELFYEYQTDSFTSRDLSVLSDHLLKYSGGLIRSTYQQQPFGVLWFVAADGALIGLTFEKDQEVIAWHKHTISGGLVTSMTVVPAHDGSQDQLHLIVKRTINGSEVYYIERLTNEFYPTRDTDTSEMVYLDCSNSYTGSTAVATVSGLGFLEGQTVSVVGDGSVQDERVVTGGSITLARPASNILVGLPYVSELETLNVEAGAQFGSSQGLVRRVHSITLRVFASLGFRYGVTDTDIYTYNFRGTGDKMDMVPSMRSDDIHVNVSGNYGINQSLRIEQTSPYPLNVMAVIHHMKVNQ